MFKVVFSQRSLQGLRNSWVVTPSMKFSSGNLKDSFEQAVKSIQKGPNSPKPKKDVDNMMKLQLYSFFKQATEGSVKGDRPGMFNLVERAKYDAWAALGNMSKEDAQLKYIDVVKDIFGGELPKLSQTASTTSDASTNSATATAAAIPAAANYSGPSYKSLADVAIRRKRDLPAPNLTTVLTSVDEQGVGRITLNRPNRGNAFNFQQWEEFRQVWNYFNQNASAKVIILSGSGNAFSTGMDLSVFGEMQSIVSDITCDARKRESGIYHIIEYLQDIISAPENCPVPVIAAVHGNCIGGAVDLICAADLRYCTKDAVFSIKETDLAMVADIGTLQRLPKLIGTQRAAELTYTGRNFSGKEAEEFGLVVKAFDTKEEMNKHVSEVATQIAKKSPITIRGVKKTILYTRDHTVQDSLNQIKLWNTAYLYSNDLVEAAMAIMSKKTPEFKED